MDRFSRDRQSQTGTAFVSSKERTLLVVFFGLALALTSALVVLDRKAQPTIEADPVATGTEAVPYDLKVAVLPFEPKIDRLNELIDESTASARTTINYEALNLHAKAVRTRPHVHFVYDETDAGRYMRLRPQELADPARGESHRARPVDLIGALLDAEIIDAQKSYGLDPEAFSDAGFMWQGTLDCDGQPVRFLLIGDGQSGGSMPEVGTRMKILGSFHQVIEGALSEDQALVTMPLILGKKLVKAIPVIASGPLDPELAGVVRYTEENDLKRLPQTEDAFFRVLGHALGRGEELSAKAAELKLLSGLEPRDRPDDFRFNPVRVQGEVVYIRAESFGYSDLHEDDAPARGFWHVILSSRTPERDVPISVVLCDHLVPDELRDWTKLSWRERQMATAPSLDLVGIFYRVHGFEGRGNKREGLAANRTAYYPLVLAAARPTIGLPIETAVDDSSFMYAFLGLGGLLVAVLLGLLWRDRRRSRALEERLRERRMARNRSRRSGTAEGGAG